MTGFRFDASGSPERCETNYKSTGARSHSPKTLSAPYGKPKGNVTTDTESIGSVVLGTAGSLGLGGWAGLRFRCYPSIGKG